MTAQALTALLDAGENPVYVFSTDTSARNRLAERLTAVERSGPVTAAAVEDIAAIARSEEHTSELQSLRRISYAVFACVDLDRKSTRLNSSHSGESRMPSSA